VVLLTLMLGGALGIAPAAFAGTTAIDAASAESLGMPRLHEPFTDCNCVAMTWDSSKGPLTLEVGRDQVDHLEHDVSEVEAPNRLTLVTTAGQRIPLEEAPCVFAERAADKYTTVLDIPVEIVGEQAADGSTCGDTFQDLREWSDEVTRRQHENLHYIESSDLQLASLKVLSSKGAAPEIAGVKRALAASRSRAASCWGEASEATVVVKAKGGALHAKRTGDATVDACFLEMVSATAIPAGKVKVKAIFGPPEPRG